MPSLAYPQPTPSGPRRSARADFPTHTLPLSPVPSEGAWSQWTPDTGTPANVQPGASTEYIWYAATKSGPVGAGSDFSSQAWWYHSHLDEANEVNLGLLGIIIITAKGMANADATPKDIDREFICFMMVQQEQNGEQSFFFLGFSSSLGDAGIAYFISFFFTLSFSYP